MSHPRPSLARVEPLTDDETRLLAFEKASPRSPDEKTQAVKAEFGWTLTVYTQRVNALLDNPAALAAEPVLIKRLRRLRDTRRSARSARRLSAR